MTNDRNATHEQVNTLDEQPPTEKIEEPNLSTFSDEELLTTLSPTEAQLKIAKKYQRRRRAILTGMIVLGLAVGSYFVGGIIREIRSFANSQDLTSVIETVTTTSTAHDQGMLTPTPTRTPSPSLTSTETPEIILQNPIIEDENQCIGMGPRNIVTQHTDPGYFTVRVKATRQENQADGGLLQVVDPREIYSDNYKCMVGIPEEGGSYVYHIPITEGYRLASMGIFQRPRDTWRFNPDELQAIDEQGNAHSLDDGVESQGQYWTLQLLPAEPTSTPSPTIEPNSGS